MFPIFACIFQSCLCNCLPQFLTQCESNCVFYSLLCISTSVYLTLLSSIFKDLSVSLALQPNVQLSVFVERLLYLSLLDPSVLSNSLLYLPLIPIQFTLIVCFSVFIPVWSSFLSFSVPAESPAVWPAKKLLNVYQSCPKMIALEKW